MIENMLTVGQVAQKFGVSARTIRHYESIGILESKRGNESNYRLYGEAETHRIYQILLLKDMGFTLKEISSIITSDGNKNIIIQIINNRLKCLAKKSLLYSQCIDLLTEFLNTCSNQSEDNIDSFKLLNELLSSKNVNETAALKEAGESDKPNPLEKDVDLEILKNCLSDDLNPLYLPFILEHDGKLLENFFVNHRRFWGLKNVLLSDGFSLDDIYNPYNFINIIIGKLGRTASDFGIYQNEEEITYRNIVMGFCITLTGVDFNSEDTLTVLEMKLVMSVFKRALEMLELAGRLKEETFCSICKVFKISDNYTTKQEIEEFIESVIQSGGVQAYYIAKIVNNALKRSRYAGPFYVLTEPSAFESEYWELDRALDMVVGFMWSHEINPAGQPYKTLAPVIFQIAYMRARTLYAASSHTLPEIVDLEEFMIIGLELVTTDKDGEGFEKIPKFEEDYIAKGVADQIPNRVKPGLRYGLNTRRNGDYYSFISGEEVSSLNYIPEGMTGEIVPAGKYAVFSVKGGPLPYKVIETIIYIYQAWLPTSDYQWVNKPGFNLYENATERSDSYIKIYIPIGERGA